MGEGKEEESGIRKDAILLPRRAHRKVELEASFRPLVYFGL